MQPMSWLLLVAAAALVIFIVYTLIRRRSGIRQSINWETMGLSRMPGVRSSLSSRLNQKQRERLIWEALGSGDLDMMLRALDIPGYTPERHFILSSIVSVTYAMREEDPEMRALCEAIAWKHIEEFPRLARSLKAGGRLNKANPTLPRVPTFQYLATILSEKAEYDKAVEVCNRAISFGLSDGTKGDYQGRIKRIRQFQERETAERKLA